MTTVQDFLSRMQAYGKGITGQGPVDIMAGGYGKTSAPFVIGEATKTASGIMSEGYDAAFRSYAEGLGAGERERSEKLLWSLAEAGVDPLSAQRFIAEDSYRMREGVAGARAGFEAQEAEGQTALVGEAASGLVQTEQYQDYLDQQRYIAEMQAAAAKKAGKYAMWGQIAGAGLGMLAGPVGGMIGAGLGGLFGGGQPTSTTGMQGPFPGSNQGGGFGLDFGSTSSSSGGWGDWGWMQNQPDFLSGEYFKPYQPLPV